MQSRGYIIHCRTGGSICVVITRIQAGGSARKRATNDQTLVTFFVTLNDGADLLPVHALTVSVEVMKKWKIEVKEYAM